MVAVAAGMVHSMALTDDGALFYWVSSDPDLRCQQVLFRSVPLLAFSYLYEWNSLFTFHICFFYPILCSYIQCVEEI